MKEFTESELAMISKLNLAISRTLDLDEVLDITVQYTAKYINAQVCTVRLVKENYLSIGASVGHKDEFSRQHKIKIDQRLERIIRDRQPLVIPNLDIDVELPSSRLRRMRWEGMKAYLGLPLVAHGTGIGILSIYKDNVYNWSSEELDFALELANQAAIAIDHARLYREVGEKAEWLKVTQNIVKTLNSASSLDEVFHAIATQASRIVENDRISLALFDPKYRVFDLQVVAVRRGITNLTEGVQIPATDTDMEEVLISRQPRIWDNLSECTKPIFARLFLEGIRSYVSVPITADGDCMGTLNVGSVQVANFTRNHVEILQDMADHIAIAIKKAQLYERIKESEEYVLKIIQTTPNPILATDIEGKLTEFNKAAEKIFGYTRDEVLSLPTIFELFPESEKGNIQQILDRLLRGEVQKDVETSFISKPGHPIPVVASFSAIRDGKGKVIGTVGILTDLSEQRQLQERIIYSEKLKTLGELSAGICHDMNNQLFSIIVPAQTLLGQITDEEHRQALQLIERAASDCAEMIKKVQAFSRKSADVPFYRVDMSEIVTEALNFTRSKWESEAYAAGIELNVTVEMKSVPPVSGNEAELRAVIANLILNAIEAMPEGGNLNIRLEHDSEQVEVFVEDTGAGMPEEVQKQLFNPFFTTKGKAGTGLGLSEAYKIVERHSGEITFESQVGEGSRFRVSLPLDWNAQEPEKEEVRQTSPTHILVVDDNEYVCDQLVNWLREAGHTVTKCITASNAIKEFQEEKHRIVFTNLSMPEMSGWDMAKEVKHISPNSKVVLVTGWGERVDQHKVHEAKIDFVISKPPHDYQVLNAVAKMMEG